MYSRYYYSPWHCCHAKTVTFCNISVFTEDIFLETQSLCSLFKVQSILSRETIQIAFFFSELCHSFDLDFLSTAQQSVGLCMRCCCFFRMFSLVLQIFLNLEVFESNSTPCYCQISKSLVRERRQQRLVLVKTDHDCTRMKINLQLCNT